MPALKTSYMKTAKTSWLRAVRQSHAARVYGRDSHFWADRAVFPPNRPANEKDALRLDRAWREGQKREFELAKPRTDTSHSKRLGASVLSSFVFLDRTGLSTTDITLVMFDCCSIIGSATTLRAKIWGSSATTLTVSSRRATCRTIESVWWPPASNGDREVHRLEARQDCSDEVVARPA